MKGGNPNLQPCDWLPIRIEYFTDGMNYDIECPD